MSSIVYLDDFLLTVLVALFVFSSSWLRLRYKRHPKYPPGPRQLPLIGNAHQLGRDPTNTLMKWAEEYGDVFSMKVGSVNFIVLNDPKIMKQVFSDIRSAGRSTNPVNLAFSDGNYGVFFSEGVHWEQQRRFTLKTLRDFGFAKTKMEGMILEEVNSLFGWLDYRLGTPISGCRIFNGPVVNALWHIISGERNKWDGPQNSSMLRKTRDVVVALNNTQKTGLLFLPVLRYIAPEHFGWTKWLRAVTNFRNESQKSIEKHRARLNSVCPQDFTDHCLLKIRDEKDPDSSFFKESGEKNLNAIISDLFLGGSESASHSLSWICYFLCHHPHVQKKAQDELDAVVGHNCMPSITDRPKLPFIEATIMEVLRRTSVQPYGITHRITEDFEIGGYFFPKDTTILPNLFFANNDPKIWGDPEIFRPSRFLSHDGKKVLKFDEFLTFSTGRRQCLGKSLAEDTLFLFTACILQRYFLRPDPDSNCEIDVLPKGKMVNEPTPFNIIFSLRKEE